MKAYNISISAGLIDVLSSIFEPHLHSGVEVGIKFCLMQWY